jgi:hypothetical protein
MERIRISSHLTKYGWLLTALFAFSQMASATNSPPVLDLTGDLQPSHYQRCRRLGVSPQRTLNHRGVGLWDEGDSPLSIAHDVGLWMSDGTPIVVATVNNSNVAVASASPNGSSLPLRLSLSSRATTSWQPYGPAQSAVPILSALTRTPWIST